jgi:chromosome segregation ATPase
MTEPTQNNELAIFEEIRRDLIVRDGSEFNVPISKVFGQGTIAKTESFGGRSLQENARMTDLALQNVQGLQNIWNRSHTQWTWKHINLSYHSAEKNMRQIAAEMSSKKAALNEAKWNQIKSEIKLRKLEEKLEKGAMEYWDEVETKVKIAQTQEGMAEGTHYIEGAMKDVLALNELYEQLKDKLHDFTEEDIEKNETKAHLKRSIVQCIRDVRQGGAITKGEQEYMEQIGVNPTKMQTIIRDYVKDEANSNRWDTAGLMTFVDELTNQLVDVAKVDQVRMDMMGFKHEYTPGISHDKTVGQLALPKEESKE